MEEEIPVGEGGDVESRKSGVGVISLSFVSGYLPVTE